MDVIHRIGAIELAKRPRLKEAIKATKNKLHQVGGAYLSEKMPYTEWLAELEQANPDPDQLKDACRRIMRSHASTRERLPILEEFYTTIFQHVGQPKSILDVAFLLPQPL